jgi:hypothetical protein
LDGENAWEHFPDGGETFLRELYHRLTSRSDLKTTTFHEYFSTHPPTAVLNTLHTGSWIHADFDIWIGDPEENRGWELLGRTRDFVQRKVDAKEITPEQFKKAMTEIYAAEGSDWFWWYGGDFVTENDLIFDELFRTHLQNVYRIVGAPVPDVLKTNICRSELAHEARKPTELITPQIDGQITSFYEWSGAGLYEAGRSMGAMYRSDRLVDAIHFGSDLQCFYLRVDFHPHVKLPKKASVRVNFIQPHHHAAILPNLRTTGKMKGELWETNPTTGDRKLTELNRVAFDKILELAIPFSALTWTPQERVALFVQLIESDVELERHPEMGTLAFTVPDEQFEVENWRV